MWNLPECLIPSSVILAGLIACGGAGGFKTERAVAFDGWHRPALLCQECYNRGDFDSKNQREGYAHPWLPEPIQVLPIDDAIVYRDKMVVFGGRCRVCSSFIRPYKPEELEEIRTELAEMERQTPDDVAAWRDEHPWLSDYLGNFKGESPEN